MSWQPGDPPPAGWTVEAASDGSVRVLPPADRCRRASVALAGVFYFVGWIALWRRAFRTWPVVMTVFLVQDLLRLFFVLFGNEEWRASTDLLEVRRALWGARWTRQYVGASLRLRGTWPTRKASLWVVEISGRHWRRYRGEVLCPAVATPVTPRAVGEVLAYYTGWPLEGAEPAGEA